MVDSDLRRRAGPRAVVVLALLLGGITVGYTWVVARHLGDDARDTSRLLGRVFADLNHNGTLDAGIRLLQKPFNLRDLKDKVREVLDATLTPPEVEMSIQSAATQQAARAREVPPTRAQRFQLHLPLRYRRLGEKDWHDGKTENISRSGMLFQADEVLQPSSQLEINLVLPAEIAGLSETEVVCRGEVVRTVEGQEGAISPALAARILQYHFQHGPLPRA